MRGWSLALAVSAAVSVAGTADAKKNWSNWVKCDGYAEPEATGAKLLKGLVAVSALGLFGIPESFNPEGRAPGAEGTAACEAALQSRPNLPWLRRVTLNQALAIHHLEAKQPERALAAIQAAEAAAGENAANPFFARSTLVSLTLLRSVALLGLGRDEEAAKAALSAAQKRPHSLRVQLVALALMRLDAKTTPEELAVAERAAALDPDAAETAAASYLRGGRFADASRLLRAKWDRGRSAGPAKGTAALADKNLSAGVITAFAVARAGDGAASQTILETQIGELKAAAAELRSWTIKVRKEPDPGPALEASILDPVLRWRPAVEAAHLFSSGDALGARDKLNSATKLPASPLILDLAREIREALPAGERKGFIAADLDSLAPKPEAGRAAAYNRIAGAALFSILPEPEDERRLNSYSGQAGWGLKSTGFKHKKLNDEHVRVEFVGSLSSPLVVEEMTLLRAAELAIQAGHKGFAIASRSDYERQTQMTLNGSRVGQAIHAGYQTQLVVDFVDDLKAPAVLDAHAVHAALSPIYIRAGR